MKGEKAMKIKIENVNVYVIKAPSNEERGAKETVVKINRTTKNHPNMDEFIDRLTEGIHDGLKSSGSNGTANH
jgi:hypothetical protein